MLRFAIGMTELPRVWMALMMVSTLLMLGIAPEMVERGGGSTMVRPETHQATVVETGLEKLVEGERKDGKPSTADTKGCQSWTKMPWGSQVVMGCIPKKQVGS
jgi:hypothetical protein